MSDISDRLDQLEDKINKISKRNQTVETDKAWETSYIRRALLFFFTYSAIALYFISIGIERPWLNAVVPAIGFILSTLTLPFFKQLWVRYFQPNSSYETSRSHNSRTPRARPR